MIEYQKQRIVELEQLEVRRVPMHLRQQLALHPQIRDRRRSMRLDDDAQYAEVDVALSPLRTLRPRPHASTRLNWPQPTSPERELYWPHDQQQLEP